MRARVKRLVAPMVCAVALAASGCASPPTAEKEAADKALARAQAAGADKYASADFAAASDALKEAEALVAAKKYSEAKAAYAKAKETADKAAQGVEAGKADMRAQVEKLLTDTAKQWQALQDRVSAAGKRLKPEQQETWKSDVKVVAESLDATRAALGDNPAGAKDKLAPVAAAIQKWEGELKALPAAVPAPTARAPKKK